MNRRSAIRRLATLFLTTASLAHAQQPKKLFRIGYLSAVDAATESARAEGIRLALRQFSYIEGQNIAIEYRYGEGKRDWAPEYAAELVRLKVDIIVVAGGEPWVLAAKNATKTIPIVMVGGGSDPVEAGLIESLARPGGNLTGITNLSRQLGGKRLELLKDAVGKVARVAVLYNANNLSSAREAKEDLPIAARALKLTLQTSEVKTTDEFEQVFAGMVKQRLDGLFLLGGGGLLDAHRKRVVNFALKNRVPSMLSRRAVEDGGLMSYSADIEDSYRQIAWYVDRILKGSKPADLPVQQPMRFEFVINLQTAKKIGVTINTDVLARATKIIR